MRLQITFKSGAQVEVDVEDFTAGVDRATGGPKLSWKDAEDWTSRLDYVDPAEVVAIMAVQPGAALLAAAGQFERIGSDRDGPFWCSACRLFKYKLGAAGCRSEHHDSVHALYIKAEGEAAPAAGCNFSDCPLA